MSAGTIVYGRLTSGPLNALVGDRIYPIAVPDINSLPAVAYRRSTTEYLNTIHLPAEAMKVVYDLICAADSALAAEQLGDAVETITGWIPLNRTDEYDPDTGIYATVITVEVFKQ